MSPRYDLTVRSEEPIPEDVLVEHVAVALRDFKFTGKVDVQVARQHPFDGPEVFDDYIRPGNVPGYVYDPENDDDTKPEYEIEPPTTKSLSGFAKGGYTGTHGEGRFTPAGIVHKGDAYIPKRAIQMAGLDALERMMNIARKTPEDPYPNVAEAAFQLREDRDRGGA